MTEETQEIQGQETDVWRPRINGVDPFYRCRMVEAMFDQSELTDYARVLPLRPFQKSILAASTMYNFLDIYAPSQSGKTIAAAALVAELMYEYPGLPALVLSTKDTQAERINGYIRNLFIHCHRDPRLRTLDRKGGDSASVLRLAESGSQVVALPHSMQALTGNPAAVIILDEVARWDKEDPTAIFSEAVARLGDQTWFLIVTISTFHGESQPNPGDPNGFSGSFFHWRWRKSWDKRRDQSKKAAAFRFTYHVSPRLTANIKDLKTEMDKQGPGYFGEHYLGIPRATAGTPLFEGYYSEEHHVKPDAKCLSMLSDTTFLFLCFDPGVGMQAATLGQLDMSNAKLIYLRSYTAQNQRLDNFIDSVLMKVRKEFIGWSFMYFMDVSGKKRDEQTLIPNSMVLRDKCGQMPILQYQLIAPGVSIIKSFMSKRDGFVISDHPECLPLRNAYLKAEAEKRGLSLQEVYKKDGFHEHPLDSARYPVYYLSGGYAPEAWNKANSGYSILSSPYDV